MRLGVPTGSGRLQPQDTIRVQLGAVHGLLCVTRAVSVCEDPAPRRGGRRGAGTRSPLPVPASRPAETAGGKVHPGGGKKQCRGPHPGRLTCGGAGQVKGGRAAPAPAPSLVKSFCSLSGDTHPFPLKWLT